MRRGKQIVHWRNTLRQKWGTIRFGEITVETDGDRHKFDVQVYLDDLDPSAVRVELYADGIDGERPVRQEMTRIRPLVGATGGYNYHATVPSTRPARDYTARIIPQCAAAAVPLECDCILWQR